jgi:hypothetical protein
MSIQVRIRSVYGNDYTYPVCDTAKLLCSLTGAKTFTVHALTVIRELGYIVQYVV